MEAAFFDLDKTVIAKASMLAFGPPFYKEGLISRRTVIRSAYAQLIYRHLGANDQKLARLRETVLALTKGWDQNRVTQIVTRTLTEIVEPLIYKEALDLMEFHRSQGRLIYLVSASPIEILTPLGDFLNVDDVNWLRKGQYLPTFFLRSLGQNPIRVDCRRMAYGFEHRDIGIRIRVCIAVLK